MCWEGLEMLEMPEVMCRVLLGMLEGSDLLSNILQTAGATVLCSTRNPDRQLVNSMDQVGPGDQSEREARPHYLVGKKLFWLHASMIMLCVRLNLCLTFS